MKLIRSIAKAMIVFLFLLFSPIMISTSSSSMAMPIDNSGKFLEILYSEVAPPSVQMDYYITKYAKIYDIPLGIAYKVAKLETGYKGPSHYEYKHDLTSSANAEGPMQVLLSTAKEVSNDNGLTREELRNNIELNVSISLKYLRQLHDRYKDWKIVLGFYNTGYPIVNDYALTASK